MSPSLCRAVQAVLSIPLPGNRERRFLEDEIAKKAEIRRLARHIGGYPDRFDPLFQRAETRLWAREYVAGLGERDWQRLTVAEGAKGRRVFDFAFLRGVAKRGGLPGRDAWLMVRRSLDQTPEIKYYLSNAPADVDTERMAVVGSERWRVESAIKEAKSQTGLDESEGRNWKHWHHHTTLSMLAQAFLTCARVTGAYNLSQKGSFGR